MRDLLPTEVFSAIQGQFREAMPLTPDDYWDSQADEDSLTGAFGKGLRLSVRGSAGGFSWTTSYTKLRGRGRDAPEKAYGADGLIELEVVAADGKTVVGQKAVFFQAKKDWSARDSRLSDQMRKVIDHAPGAGVVVNYTREGAFAATAEAVVKAEGRLAQLGHDEIQSIGDLLADRFLPCKVGMRGMYFDAARERLLLARENELVTLRLSVGVRVRTVVRRRRTRRR